MSLMLDWSDHLIDHVFPSLHGFLSDCFGALRSLDVRMQRPDCITTNTLLSWCTLPRLRVLTIDADIRGLKSDASTGLSKIQSLRVVNNLWYLVYSALFVDVIPELRFLTTLGLSMPGHRYTPRLSSDNEPSALDDETFSSSDSRSRLASTPRSLKHLSMVSAEHIIFPSHDGSVLNLSKFRHLTKAKLSAHFFGGMSTKSSRYKCLKENLADLLPASLQELEIILDGVHGLFYGLRDLESIQIQWKDLEGGQEEAEELFSHYWRSKTKSQTFVLERLRWITDLLAAQRVELPRLTRLLISEGMSPRPFEYTDLARDFPLLIEGSGVDVQVLRKTAGACRASNLPT